MPSLSGYKSELDYSYAPGIFPSMECLLARPERVRRLLLHSGAAGREGAEKLTALAREIGVRTEEADRALGRISGKENCYAAAVFEKFEDALDPEKPQVLLHQPGDGGNVGTILRTADAFGADGLFLLPGCADPYSPKTVRASMGAVFRCPVWQCAPDDLKRTLDSSAIPLYGAALREDTVDARTVRYDRSAIAIGSEGRGLSPEVLDLCNATVRIPMEPRCESLNAAIAAAVLLWEAYR